MRRVVISAAAIVGAAVGAINAQSLPAALQKTVDTSYPVQTGATISVPAGGDFQGALDRAQLGDTIVLQAGASYSGSFTLRPKSGSGWIIVRTSAPDSSLPRQGRRITPAYASVMPKIVAGSAAAVQTAPGAHHYRFAGVEITLAAGVPVNYGLVLLGDGSSLQNSLSQVPYALVFDRVYVHGNATGNLRRGIALNSASAAVIDSYISDVHEVGADSQAIGGWNGPGPYKIANNYLEGAGENVMFGGSDPAIPNLVPADIEVRGNYFYKPLRWKIGHPTYAGTPWTVKNLFELKNARRVLVDGNVFEHNWLHAQNGFSILFTVRNQSGTAPWSVVEDVTFTNNIVRHVSSGVNILGQDDIHPSQQTKRILIKNNLFDDLNATTFGGSGRLFQVLSGTADVTIDHNTAFQTSEVIAAAGTANSRFVYRNNLSPHNTYGIGGDGTYGSPSLTLSTYFPGAVFVRNVLAGGNPLSYPLDNFFPPSMAGVLFVNLAGGNYRLQPISPYKNAGTDGKDVGADFDALTAATDSAVSGNSPSGPAPVDSTAPSVSINSPAAATTVSGTIAVTAIASDNVGVAGVQFLLDGSPLGAEDTAGPYEVSWNSGMALDGAHILTALARDAAGNTTTSAPNSVTVGNAPPPPAPMPQSPFTALPWPVPGQFEAEDFDRGGEGIAYHDLTVGNQGGQYRTDADVDIVSPYAGGYVVNNFQTGEWLEHTIRVSYSGTYILEALVSSRYNTSRFHFEVDGTDVTGAIEAPNTGSWGTFQWVGKGGISLTAGQHVLRIYADEEYFNLDAIRIKAPPRSPFSALPWQVPGQVEAEDFDRGGEGIAYHDLTVGNQGGQYRTDADVDIVTPYTSGYVVNNFQTGEWLEYTINVAQSAAYILEALVSSRYITSRFHFEVDGTDITGVIEVPNSGSWGTFQWVGKSGISLTAGQHVLRIYADEEYFNLDAIRIKVPPQSPFSALPWQAPGQFEAEDFDRGGEGIAYHDLTVGNQGGHYRTDADVDIVSPYAGGYVVNNFQSGEWLEYTINVAQPGTYRLEALVSTQYNTSLFHFEVDGTDIAGMINVPNTGWWGTFQWVGKSGISLTAGQHVLRIDADAEYFNLDAIRIVN